MKVSDFTVRLFAETVGPRARLAFSVDGETASMICLWLRVLSAWYLATSLRSWVTSSRKSSLLPSFGMAWWVLFAQHLSISLRV